MGWRVQEFWTAQIDAKQKTKDEKKPTVGIHSFSSVEDITTVDGFY